MTMFYDNKWTLTFTSDLVSRSPLKPHVHVCIRISHAV